MKALAWSQFLEVQRRDHGKLLFRVAELANVAQRDPHALNVELARLVKRRVLARYATGVYGLPGAASIEDLVPVLDADAYVTGLYALYRHNLVTQVPTGITCFTNHRHNISARRATPLGTIEFHCVNSRIYAKPARGVMVPPEQALCDYVYLMLRKSLDPLALVTFRNLSRVRWKKLVQAAARYPPAVGVYIGNRLRPD